MTAPAAAPAETSALDPQASMRGGLIAAAAELSLVATSAEQLQSALSPLLQRGGEAAEAAQALDEITQHLQGLGEFLAAIARDCPPEWTVDLEKAAGRLRLHAQQQRLTLTEPTPAGAASPLPRPPMSGDLDLW